MIAKEVGGRTHEKILGFLLYVPRKVSHPACTNGNQPIIIHDCVWVGIPYLLSTCKPQVLVGRRLEFQTQVGMRQLVVRLGKRERVCKFMAHSVQDGGNIQFPNVSQGYAYWKWTGERGSRKETSDACIYSSRGFLCTLPTNYQAGSQAHVVKLYGTRGLYLERGNSSLFGGNHRVDLRREYYYLSKFEMKWNYFSLIFICFAALEGKLVKHHRNIMNVQFLR